MIEFLAPYYDWIKAFHIISVISWMAGMLYLPRIFVYHSETATVGSELDETFKTMERKLLKVIMGPAMGAAWFFGLLMIFMGAFDFSSIWPWVKLVSVFVLSGVHGWLTARQKDFENGTNTISGRTYRIMNEVPAVLMVLIVIFVVVRPF